MDLIQFVKNNKNVRCILLEDAFIIEIEIDGKFYTFASEDGNKERFIK